MGVGEGIALAAAVAATAGSTYVAVDSAGKQAKAAANAQQLELNQYAEEKKAAQDEAAQQTAEILRQQEAAKSATRARRAAAGLDPFSPTGRVLLDQSDDEALADLQSVKANSGRSMNKLNIGASSSTLRAGSAISSAGSQAMGALASGVGSIARTGYSYLSTAGSNDTNNAARRATAR